jgi:transcriptional regulator with XRE-family HTH domain
MSDPLHARVTRPIADPPLAQGVHAVPSPLPIDHLGPRLKHLRQNAGLSLRELARQAKVSPSLVSQIENGKSRPSVSTLYGFARLLEVTVDELFDAEDLTTVAPHVSPSAQPDAPTDPANAWHPSEYANRISVLHPSHRSHLRMAEGVDWERLAATPERDINFMKITYAPGAASTGDGAPMVHEGYEYGYVLAGILQVTVGDEEFVLRAGESLGFNSLIPHVLRNIADEEFQGIWFVHGSSH